MVVKDREKDGPEISKDHSECFRSKGGGNVKLLMSGKVR